MFLFCFLTKMTKTHLKNAQIYYLSTLMRIQPNLFKFSVNVVLPKTNLLSTFHSSTTYHTSHLSQDPPHTQLGKLSKYPKFRPKYLQWRSMLLKTQHIFLKVRPHTNIICKNIFGHSLNYSTGWLQTRRPRQGSLLTFFSLEHANSVIMTHQQAENATKIVAHHTL